MSSIPASTITKPDRDLSSLQERITWYKILDTRYIAEKGSNYLFLRWRQVISSHSEKSVKRLFYFYQFGANPLLRAIAIFTWVSIHALRLHMRTKCTSSNAKKTPMKSTCTTSNFLLCLGASISDTGVAFAILRTSNVILNWNPKQTPVSNHAAIRLVYTLEEPISRWNVMYPILSQKLEKEDGQVREGLLS